MGRYTSLQSYSDFNIAQQKAPETFGKSAEEAQKGGHQKISVEKVNNVSGSCAGAGSGDFHQYRAIRRSEMERMRSLEVEKRKVRSPKLYIANSSFSNSEKKKSHFKPSLNLTSKGMKNDLQRIERNVRKRR